MNRPLNDMERARRLYRLCCGIEFALVNKGYRATVQAAIEAAGMSRRTFYEVFEANTGTTGRGKYPKEHGLHDACKRMQIAMGRATKREFRRLSDAGHDHKDLWRKAYVRSLSRFPSADTMLSAMACEINIDASRMMHLDAALDVQSYIATQFGQRPLPEPGPFDEQILLWARDMGVDGLSRPRAEAAQ